MHNKKSKIPTKKDYVCSNYDGLTGKTKFPCCIGFTSDGLKTQTCRKCHTLFCSSCFNDIHTNENCNDRDEHSIVFTSIPSIHQCNKSSLDINIDW